MRVRVLLRQWKTTPHVETVVLLSHKKPDGHINVKVEFGEGEGKVPLDNIAKRAESYKPKERVTYKMTLTSGVTNSHGVTGGVYKTRERIHRDILIRDY